jgi:hypothetical protein
MKGSNRKNVNFGGYISTRIKNVVISNYLSYLRSNASNSTYGSFSEYARQNPYWNPYDSVTGEMSRVLEEYTYQGNTVRYYNPAYNGTISTTDETAYSRISNLTNINWMIGHGFSLNGSLGSVNNLMNRIFSFRLHILLLLIILPVSFSKEECIIKPPVSLQVWKEQ